jgi:hypothetical protein
MMTAFTPFEIETATARVLTVLLTRRDMPDREDVTQAIPTREVALDRLIDRGLVRVISRFSGNVLVFDEPAVARLIAGAL